MDKIIQFIVNYDDWQAVKKLKIDEKTDPKTVMEFLASLGTSLDSKIEENLRRVVELDRVDSALNQLGFGGSVEQIAAALRAVNGGDISLAIKEIVAKPGLRKSEQRELEQFCKVYALRKALKRCGLSIDYSVIQIPGLKRLLRTKV